MYCVADFKGDNHTLIFMQVVGYINKNMHLVEKLFRETILPLIQLVGPLDSLHVYTLPSLHRYPPVASRCNERKREIMVKLESKIETGIEKLVLQWSTPIPIRSYSHS